MKILQFFILISFTIASLSTANAQDTSRTLKAENIKQIFIRDLQDLEAAGSYSTIYEVIPAGSNFQIYRIKQSFRLESTEELRNFDLVQSDKRTKIKDIDPKVINDLVKAINEPVKRADVEFLTANNWRKNQLPEYITSSSIDDKKLSSTEINNCLSIIEQERIKEADLAKFFDTKWAMDHPEIAVYIITATDTVGLLSRSVQPYMLPWKVKGKAISYNKNISTALAAIIPALHYSNVERLSGKYFEEDLADYLVNEYCAGPVKKNRIRQQFSSHFKNLEPHFRIVDFEYGHKSDIEIDDQFLELKLKTKELPENFYFASKFPQKGNNLVTTDAFLNNYKTQITTIKKADWLYKYLQQQKPEVEIAFADEHSFTHRAENFFVNDTKGFINNNKIQNTIKDAVLVKVSEGKGKYSRWLILPDGRVILWHYKGNGALMFTDQQLGITNQSVPLKVVGKFTDQQGLVK